LVVFACLPSASASPYFLKAWDNSPSANNVTAKKMPPTSELMAFKSIMIARMMQTPKNIVKAFFLVMITL
jgi:hypothetical protein